MKYRIYLILIFITSQKVYSQNLFPIKELCDDMYPSIIVDCRFLNYINDAQGSGEFKPLEWKKLDNASQNQLGDGTALVLSSLVKIYETTKDKAYLYKAKNAERLLIQNN